MDVNPADMPISVMVMTCEKGAAMSMRNTTGCASTEAAEMTEMAHEEAPDARHTEEAARQQLLGLRKAQLEMEERCQQAQNLYKALRREGDQLVKS